MNKKERKWETYRKRKKKNMSEGINVKNKEKNKRRWTVKNDKRNE